MTEHIHSLKEGDELSIKGPIPKFAYKANQFDVRPFPLPFCAVRSILNRFLCSKIESAVNHLDRRWIGYYSHVADHASDRF